eukprot:1557277-Prymnesium_polylepis.1
MALELERLLTRAAEREQHRLAAADVTFRIPVISSELRAAMRSVHLDVREVFHGHTRAPGASP